MSVGLTIDPGEMTEEILIRERSRVSDGGGGSVETWSTLATVWAKVKPMRGGDVMQAQQIESRRGYEITIRYRSDLKDDMAIVWNSRPLAIRFIADFGGRSHFMRLECEMGITAEQEVLP